MIEILLTAILIVLILTYLNWTPGNVGDYLGWRHSQIKRRINEAQARRRKRK